ncbi:MAG: hypothetical protein VX589_20285, partial [Myxococcota bacterium]|nr:hypothetical protein [Myxococcota bacterium]
MLFLSLTLAACTEENQALTENEAGGRILQGGSSSDVNERTNGSAGRSITSGQETAGTPTTDGGPVAASPALAGQASTNGGTGRTSGGDPASQTSNGPSGGSDERAAGHRSIGGVSVVDTAGAPVSGGERSGHANDANIGASDGDELSGVRSAQGGVRGTGGSTLDDDMVALAGRPSTGGITEMGGMDRLDDQPVGVPPLRPGVQRVVLRQLIDGIPMPRVFWIHAPEVIEPDGAYPVLFAFHGDNEPAQQFIGRFAQYVRSGTFVGIYPEGSRNSWQLGRDPSNIDDVGFVGDIIAQLEQYEALSQSKPFAMGHLSGAGMVQKIAIEASLFQAIAPFGSALLQSSAPQNTTTRLSVIQFHGTDARRHPYNGGRGFRGYNFQAAEASAQLWADHNACQQSTRVNTSEDNLRVAYDGCSDGTSVIHYGLRGQSDRVDLASEDGLDEKMLRFFGLTGDEPADAPEAGGEDENGGELAGGRPGLGGHVQMGGNGTQDGNVDIAGATSDGGTRASAGQPSGGRVENAGEMGEGGTQTTAGQTATTDMDTAGTPMSAGAPALGGQMETAGQPILGGMSDAAGTDSGGGQPQLGGVPADDQPLQPGLTRVTLVQLIDNQPTERHYLVHAPQNIDPTMTYPILFAFHGSGGQAQQFTNRFQRYIDQGHFVGVYPQGHQNVWNMGLEPSNADDVAFVEEIVARLRTVRQLSRDKPFATGSSNGAGIIQKIAIEASLFEGIAPFSTALFVDTAPAMTTAPVSVIQFHGTQDPTCPYNGGPGVLGYVFRAAETSAQIWADHNGCDPAIFSQTADNNRRFAYDGCDEGKAVIHYGLTGQGHGLNPNSEEGARGGLDGIMLRFFGLIDDDGAGALPPPGQQ